MPPDTIFVTLTVRTELRGSLNRTTRDVGARKKQESTLFAAARGSGKRWPLLLFILASSPPSLSLSLSLFLFCLPSVRQRPELHGMLACRPFAVKCTGQCIFVVARYTRAARATTRPGPYFRDEAGRSHFFPGRGKVFARRRTELEFFLITLMLFYY